MLDGIGVATGTVMRPIVKSQTGEAFLAMVPGEVLLASLDAVSKVFDAAEIAEKQVLSATSCSATRMVTNRGGHRGCACNGRPLCAGTAWNVLKIRKAINPASSVSTGVLKNAAKDKNRK